MVYIHHSTTRYRSRNSKPLNFKVRIIFGLLGGLGAWLLVIGIPPTVLFTNRQSFIKKILTPAAKTWVTAVGSFRVQNLRFSAGAAQVVLAGNTGAEPQPFDDGWDIAAAIPDRPRYRLEATGQGGAMFPPVSTYDPAVTLMSSQLLRLSTQTNATILQAPVPLIIPRSFAAPQVGFCPDDSTYTTANGMCTRWLQLSHVCVVVFSTGSGLNYDRPGCAFLSKDAIAAPVATGVEWNVKGTGVFGYKSLASPPVAPLSFDDVVLTVRSKDDLYVTQQTLTAKGDPLQPTMSYGELPPKDELTRGVVAFVFGLVLAIGSFSTGGLFTICWLFATGLNAVLTCRARTYLKEHGGRMLRMWNGRATVADMQHPSVRGVLGVSAASASLRNLTGSRRQLDVSGSRGLANNDNAFHTNVLAVQSHPLSSLNNKQLEMRPTALQPEPVFPPAPSQRPPGAITSMAQLQSLAADAGLGSVAGSLSMPVHELAMVRPAQRKSLGLSTPPPAPMPAAAQSSLPLGATPEGQAAALDRPLSSMRSAALAAVMAQRLSSPRPVIKVSRTNEAGIVTPNEAWKARLDVAPSSHSLASIPGVVGTHGAGMVPSSEEDSTSGRAGTLLGSAASTGGPTFASLIDAFDSASTEEALLDLLMQLQLLVGSLPEADRTANGADMKRALTGAASVVKQRHEGVWTRTVAASFLEVVKKL